MLEISKIYGNVRERFTEWGVGGGSDAFLSCTEVSIFMIRLQGRLCTVGGLNLLTE